MLWPVNSESATALIQGCQTFFHFTGCPEQFWSDRGGAFDSHEFRRFANELGTTIKLSSAEYPQSNGSAESAVKIFKGLQATSCDDTEFLKAGLYLQNTTKAGHSYSSAEAFLGQSVQTPLQMQPRKAAVSWEVIEAERMRDQTRMKQIYNQTATRVCKPFEQGDRVLLHNVKGKNVTATILDRAVGPRAYNVRLDTGTNTTRNRKFLTPLPRLDVTVTTGNHSPTATENKTKPPRILKIPLPGPSIGASKDPGTNVRPVVVVTRSGRHVQTPKRD